MSRLALATGTVVTVYGIGLTALGLRRWPAPSPPPARIHMRTTTMLDPWLQQPQHDCPNCGCCSAALCRRAAMTLRGCAAHTPEEYRQTVAACPCSARAIAAAGARGAAHPGGPEQASWEAAAPLRADPAVPIVTSLGPVFPADPGFAAPAGFVAVHQVTTAVFRVRQWAGTVHVAGGEPW